jgi:hypothetical protein
MNKYTPISISNDKFFNFRYAHVHFHTREEAHNFHELTKGKWFNGPDRIPVSFSAATEYSGNKRVKYNTNVDVNVDDDDEHNNERVNILLMVISD